MLYRIKNAFKIFFWALRNPRLLQHHNFKMMSDLLVMIMNVANEDRAYMTHIAYVHPDEGEKQIVSIWAGSGLGAEPTKRISQLLEENSQLREQISEMVKKSTQQ